MYNQELGTARANVARPRRCSAAAPVFRPAHLTVGQAATRPLSVPGQRLIGWPSCATTDRPGYEGAHAPQGLTSVRWDAYTSAVGGAWFQHARLSPRASKPFGAVGERFRV